MCPSDELHFLDPAICPSVPWTLGEARGYACFLPNSSLILPNLLTLHPPHSAETLLPSWSPSFPAFRVAEMGRCSEACCLSQWVGPGARGLDPWPPTHPWFLVEFGKTAPDCGLGVCGLIMVLNEGAVGASLRGPRAPGLHVGAWGGFPGHCST